MITYELRNDHIIKLNCENEYEPAEFKKYLVEQEKKLKEMTAQKKIYDAKKDNVSRNHPHVLEVDDEKRNAIWMYQENYVSSIQAQTMIDAFTKSIEDLKAEMKEIEEQTGYDFELE